MTDWLFSHNTTDAGALPVSVYKQGNLTLVVFENKIQNVGTFGNLFDGDKYITTIPFALTIRS